VQPMPDICLWLASSEKHPLLTFSSKTAQFNSAPRLPWSIVISLSDLKGEFPDAPLPLRLQIT
jgi:hypothetical protein